MQHHILPLLLSLFLIGLSANVGHAQDPRLGEQYYRTGEYEKASIIFRQVYERSPGNDYYFDRYLDCILLLEKYNDAEKELKQRLKATPQKVQLYVKLGEVYERQFDQKKADKQYEKAIENMPRSQGEIMQLARAFMQITKYDLALQAYERGATLLNDATIFAYDLAELYRRKGERTPMVRNYLTSLAAMPGRLNTLQTIFERYFTEEDYRELKMQLYTAINQQPNELIYVELLAWVFTQNKDYNNALRQLKALDKREDGNGGRIFNLARTAKLDKDYKAAIAAYEYLIQDKGNLNTYFFPAQKEALQCQQQLIVEGYDYTDEDLKSLQQRYENFFSAFGKNANSAGILLEMARFEALYLNDLNKAISLLEELVQIPGVLRNIVAQAKLDLGDYYLMAGDVWEATLLYGQVDKANKDDVLGQMARFKNAQLSYFKGDFEWAQTQFSVLKASTSKLIANDALDLSIFILDNLALDTVATPMYWYAQAELLIFQNQFEAAFAKMDSITATFPEHALQDDILYAKARIYEKQRNYPQAATTYQQLIDGFTESIRLDNALFALAELNENRLNDPKQAQALYERIILDFSNSTFAVEARKRYRRLRGDNIQ